MAELFNTYRGAILNAAAGNVIVLPTDNGTITGVYLDMPSNVTGTALFNLTLDGVELISNATLRITTGTASVNLTGLSHAMTIGSLLALNLESPLPATLPDPTWSLKVTYTPTTYSDAASTTEVLTGTAANKAVTPDALAALWEQGSDITSAATISVGEGGYFNVTGSTGPITDIDFGTTKAGRIAWLKFASTPQINHHATTLILPTGANITAAAGDVAAFVSEGGDNVRCIHYMRASGQALAGSSSIPYTAASASGAASLEFAEDTDNGTNKVTLQGPASTADVTVTLPSTAGTVALTSQLPNSFSTVAVSGQSDVVADSTADTLTLVAGANITITTNAGSDSVTIAGTGGATLGDGDYGDIVVSGSGTVLSIDSGVIVNADINASAAIDISKLGTSTTQALGVGSVELGHASDTTLSRSAAGVLAVEGVVVPTVSSTSTFTNKTISLTAGHGSDDTYEGLQIPGLNNSGGVTQWDAVYLNSSSQWVIADANGSSTYPAQGLAVATVATANPVSVLTYGTVRNDAWNWTVGGLIYLSTTAGGLTQTAPSASGDKVQVMGYALTADIMFVNPQLHYITIT